MNIEWIEPPPVAPGDRRPGARGLFVAELRKRPGEWAKYPVRIAPNSCNINKKIFPGTEWVSRDVRVDAMGKRTADVYARYVGTEATS